MASSKSQSIEPGGFHSQILDGLQHLNLNGRVEVIRDTTPSCGAFSEVFEGRFTQDQQGETKVAVKRLRFHVASQDIKKASPFLVFIIY